MTFTGVPMNKLMDAVGAKGTSLTVTALNDYATDIPIEDFKNQPVILATKRDGNYMPVRDKGPLFIVYNYDSKHRAAAPALLQPLGMAGRAHGREVDAGRGGGGSEAMWKVLAAGFGRFSNVKRLLLALLLGFLAVAVIANSVLIVNRQEALGRVSRYNLTWLLSQAAHEVLRLEETISAAALPGNHIDADAVALRLDVLANRLVLLRTGEAADFISERPDLKRNVEELEATLATIDKLIPGLPNPEVVVKIRNLLEPQVPRMLQLAAAANVRSGDIVAQDQHDLSFQHWLLTGLLVTAGLLIVVLLYRFASAQQRSRIDLEHEVGERTAELRESLDYQTAVSDVLKAISRSTFDLAPVLQVVLDTATRLCHAQVAGIYQFQEGTFRWIAGSGAGADNQDAHKAAPAAAAWDDLVVRVAGGARTVSVSNAAVEMANGAADPSGIGTMLGLPMTRDGQLIGVLALARTASRPSRPSRSSSPRCSPTRPRSPSRTSA